LPGRLFQGVVLVLALAASGAGRARADAVDDALRCLEAEARTAGRRESLLVQAESLGVRIEAAQTARGRPPQDLLRRAERLDREGDDLALQLVLQRASCREQAVPALAECRARIGRLESDLASGGGEARQAEELLRLRDLRGRLETFLAGPVFLGYPLIPPDSTDTVEILEEKLRYHEQVRDDLRGLEARLRVRRKEVAQERQSLAEASRFLRDLDFVDEGGRVSPSGSVRFRGAPPDNATPDSMRRAFGSAGMAGSGGDLNRLLQTSPSSPEESDRILRLLDGYLRAIDGEMRTVSAAADDIRRRIGGGADVPH
jgi:hypothetical protein